MTRSYLHHRFTPVLSGLYVDYPKGIYQYFTEAGTNHGLRYTMNQLLHCKQSSFEIHYTDKRPFAVFSDSNNAKDYLEKPCVIIGYEYQRRIFENLTPREARETEDYIKEKAEYLKKRARAHEKLATLS